MKYAFTPKTDANDVLVKSHIILTYYSDKRLKAFGPKI